MAFLPKTLGCLDRQGGNPAGEEEAPKQTSTLVGRYPDSITSNHDVSKKQRGSPLARLPLPKPLLQEKTETTTVAVPSQLSLMVASVEGTSRASCFCPAWNPQVGP